MIYIYKLIESCGSHLKKKTVKTCKCDQFCRYVTDMKNGRRRVRGRIKGMKNEARVAAHFNISMNINGNKCSEER